MQWFLSLLTAAWGIWTWAHEQNKNHDRERIRLTALYVNPFLSACEDLESRIYHILELNGLEKLRERYPNGIYAEETMYIIVRFFGWLALVRRYGPYTQDPVVIRFTEAIRNAFATPKYPIKAFAFFRPEQKALGKIAMEHFQGQYGIEFDSVSWSKFIEMLKYHPFSDSIAFQQSLTALREASRADDLDGRKRLAEAQHHLINLLNYLEKKEGYSLFPGERKKCRIDLHSQSLPSDQQKESSELEIMQNE